MCEVSLQVPLLLLLLPSVSSEAPKILRITLCSRLLSWGGPCKTLTQHSFSVYSMGFGHWPLSNCLESCLGGAQNGRMQRVRVQSVFVTRVKTQMWLQSQDSLGLTGQLVLLYW